MTGPHLDRPLSAIARLVRWSLTCFAVPFFVAALFAASVLPYRYWDSLAFGSWSRLIAQTGDVITPHLFANNLNRPLFYVTQGLVWHWLGYHEWVGRWLSVLVAVGFAVALWRVARILEKDGDDQGLLPPVALAIALASSVYASYVAAGMTDVPVAAVGAITAVVLWSPRPTWWRAPVVALCAAATVLAKPTGLVALAGVLLASVVLLVRPSARAARVKGLAGLAVGAAAAIAYDAAEAHRIHFSLVNFLREGNTDYYVSQGAHDRVERLLSAAWIGEAPRLLVLLGLLYACARLAGAGPRLGLSIAGPVAIAWSIAGPSIADGGAPYPFRAGFSLGLLAWIVLVAAVLVTPFLHPVDPLPRQAYALLLLWLAPGAIAWFSYRSDEVRFLSPAWPPAMLLAAAALTTVMLAIARTRRAAVLAPTAAMVLLIVANLTSIDGLGRQGWVGLLNLGWSGWSSRAAVENYAYGPFSYELDLARANVGNHQRIVSGDGRLMYFFPDRVEVRYPQTCSSLRGFRYFAILTGGESAQIADQFYGASSEPLSWAQCASPRLHMVGFQPGIWAAFVIGPPSRASTPEDCHIATAQGSLLDAVFVHDVPYAVAKSVRARAVAVGFKGALIEQTACDAFRVVVTGIPEQKAAQADFLHETTATGFHVVIQAAVRYPEVEPEIPAVPSS